MGNSCCAPAPNHQSHHHHHHQGKTPIHGRRSSNGVDPTANESRNQDMPPNRGNTQSMNATHLKPLPFPLLGIAALVVSEPDEQLNTTTTAQSDEPVTAVQSTNQVDDQLNTTKTTENRSSPSDEPVTAANQQPLALKSGENKSSAQVCKAMRSISLLPDLSESEDICSTCLDGYDEENPKIFTKCKHHYHLACIYEWMERSNTCPMCDQVMIFDESS